MAIDGGTHTGPKHFAEIMSDACVKGCVYCDKN
jgi:hypothetical protein